MATARRSRTFGAGAAHHLGLDHAAFGVDGHVHRQLAVELLALVLGEVARAALLDLAAQLVVVERVDLLARRRADVALLRPRVLLVDALLDLGQQLDQLAAPLFLLALVGRALVAQRVGRRQQRRARAAPGPAAAAASPAAARSASWCLRRRRRARSAPRAAAARWRGRPAPRRRRPGSPGRSPGRCSGASPERELTRITSSGVSWKTRLKPSGSTKRTSSSAACAAIDTASAICSVEKRTDHAPFQAAADSAIGGEPLPGSASATSTAIVSGPAAGSLVLGRRRRSARRRPRPVVEARDDAGVDVERQQVGGAEPHPHPRAARQASAPAARNTSGRVVGAHQAVLHHRRVELADAVLLQRAQGPVALDARPGSRCTRRRRRRSRRRWRTG